MLKLQTLEDLQRRVGTELGVSEFVTVDQARIDAFAAATGDRQWIHCDARRAEAESPFGGAVAHGYLTLSLGPALAEQIIGCDHLRCAINYGLNKVRFPQAVRAGARVRLRLALDQVDPIEGGVQMLQTQTFEIEGISKPACVAQWIVRWYWRERAS